MTEHVDPQEVMARLRAAMEPGSTESAVDDLIADLHPADLAEIIDSLDADERVDFFRRIPADLRAETLAEVGEGAEPLEELLGVEAYAEDEVAHERRG